jgi:MoxR-like ATPase
MFGFNKQPQAATTVTEVEISPLALLSRKQGLLKQVPKGLNYREQSLTFFGNVYGQEDIKENLYLGLASNEQINILLVGAPATSKTLYMSTIAKKCNDTLYFDASNMSGAGLIQTLYENRKVKLIIIDEIDKLNKRDLACLLGLLNDGTVVKTLKNDRISFKMENVKVFATSNSVKKLSPPIRSRFQEYHIEPYNDEEYVSVVTFCLNHKFSNEICAHIANILIENDRKDVRAAISIAALLQPNHTVEDIARIIGNWLKRKTEESVDYN